MPWPAQGRRPIDANTGNQGGIAEGIFEFSWQGETLYARNNAVGDSYLFGWSDWPEQASAHGRGKPRVRALIWRANYHPDGGQLFYPIDGKSFVVPLALPGDEVTPEQFVTFWCDGSCGLYIHPNVWHGAVVPHDDEAQLLDRQGKVHARVSVDFVKEFGCYLGASLARPAAALERPAARAPTVPRGSTRQLMIAFHSRRWSPRFRSRCSGLKL